MFASFRKYQLQLKRPSGTSRGVLHIKDTYFLTLQDQNKNGIGECALFKGLSFEDNEHYETVLQRVCHLVNDGKMAMLDAANNYPSIQIGIDQAFRNLENGGSLYFPSSFTEKKEKLTINGLIWMGSVDFMKTQIEEKLAENFRCLKLKIGVQWDEEKEILRQLRKKYPQDILEIRVDANGAFGLEKAKTVLEDLHQLQVHSIEQPIKAGNWEQMHELCKNTPTPIVLDEELIGVFGEKQTQMLDTIQPQYLIFKPSLLGSFTDCDHWINHAESRNIPWWITSALESNIGLNAISQYTASKKVHLPQGLGTGSLYTNNLPSSLVLQGDQLSYNAL